MTTPSPPPEEEPHTCEYCGEETVLRYVGTSPEGYALYYKYEIATDIIHDCERNKRNE